MFGVVVEEVEEERKERSLGEVVEEEKEEVARAASRSEGDGVEEEVKVVEVEEEVREEGEEESVDVGVGEESRVEVEEEESEGEEVVKEEEEEASVEEEGDVGVEVEIEESSVELSAPASFERLKRKQIVKKMISHLRMRRETKEEESRGRVSYPSVNLMIFFQLRRKRERCNYR